MTSNFSTHFLLPSKKPELYQVYTIASNGVPSPIAGSSAQSWTSAHVERASRDAGRLPASMWADGPHFLREKTGTTSRDKKRWQVWRINQDGSLAEMPEAMTWDNALTELAKRNTEIRMTFPPTSPVTFAFPLGYAPPQPMHGAFGQGPAPYVYTSPNFPEMSAAYTQADPSANTYMARPSVTVEI